MKKRPTPQIAESSARSKAKFTGTCNPRHLRAIAALLASPQPREVLDNRVGCSNSPELVAELRRRGLDLPCQRTPCIDRDGFPVKRGIYFLTPPDKRKIRLWQRKRQLGPARE
jgi:hypothetical protein